MMDSSNGSKEMQANLCRNGCGFYGSAATEGMCSKCYKDYMRKKQNSPVQTLASSNNTTSSSSATQTPNTNTPAAPLTAATTATTTTTVTSIAASSNERVEVRADEECSSPASSDTQLEAGASPTVSTDSQDSSDGSDKGKKKRNRCHTCRKKVGLTGFECRCGGLYCSIHRYSDKHECSFDYRSHGQEEIRKNNPVVVGEKIQKL